MGYFFEFLAIKKGAEGILPTIFKWLNFTPTEMEHAITSEWSFDSSKNKGCEYITVCEFQNWTILQGSAICVSCERSHELAKLIEADVCYTIGESISNAIFMEYAKPDGTYRMRSFDLSNEDAEPEIVITMGRAGEKPRDLEFEGIEETKGEPLNEERVDLIISTPEKLFEVLKSIGVPLGEFTNYYYGDFDWNRLEPIPGKGVKRTDFTAYIYKPNQDKTTKKTEKSWTSRLFKRS